jgi:uncharacterized protein (TIGR03086 family)
MTTSPEATSVAAGTELLERAIAYTRASLALVTPDSLWRPTPCLEWDLAALLVHMDDSLDALLDAVVLGHVDLRPRAGAPHEGSCVAVVGSLRDQACRLLGTWSELPEDALVTVGGHPLPAGLVAVTGALEITVHGWDVARACGQDRPLPEPLAAELLAVAPALVTEADRAGRFAPALPVDALASTAPAGTRLLAFTGRAAGRA